MVYEKDLEKDKLTAVWFDEGPAQYDVYAFNIQSRLKEYDFVEFHEILTRAQTGPFSVPHPLRSE